MQRKSFPVSPWPKKKKKKFIRVNLRVPTIAFCTQQLLNTNLLDPEGGPCRERCTRYIISQCCRPQRGFQYQAGDNAGPYNQLPASFQRLPQKSRALITQVPGRPPWWRTSGWWGDYLYLQLYMFTWPAKVDPGLFRFTSTTESWSTSVAYSSMTT